MGIFRLKKKKEMDLPRDMWWLRLLPCGSRLFLVSQRSHGSSSSHIFHCIVFYRVPEVTHVNNI